MTGPDLRRAARRLGLSGAALAAALGITDRSYRRMVAGTCPVPPGVATDCKALLAMRKD